MIATLLHGLHVLVDIVGSVVLICWAVMVLVIAEWVRQDRSARRRRPRLDRRRPSRTVPPWALEKPDLKLWLEARVAADRAAEDSPDHE